MQTQTYLFFEGRCEEAVKFYQTAVGAQVMMLMRFKDCPDPAMASPGSADKVMHVSMRIGDSTVMASDGRCTGNLAFDGISLALSVPTEAEADRTFAALGDGGQVAMPLTKTFFSPKFGMVKDQFGITWMVMVEQAA